MLKCLNQKITHTHTHIQQLCCIFLQLKFFLAELFLWCVYWYLALFLLHSTACSLQIKFGSHLKFVKDHLHMPQWFFGLMTLRLFCQQQYAQCKQGTTNQHINMKYSGGSIIISCSFQTSCPKNMVEVKEFCKEKWSKWSWMLCWSNPQLHKALA